MATQSTFSNMLNTKSVSKTPLKEAVKTPKMGGKSSYKGMCGGK